jgi:ascorbate-specific PTS system EIIC-type component UlaA
MVHKFELLVFGIDPAFAAQKYIDIWLNEFMNFGYFTYYLLLPIAVTLFVMLKKWRSLEKVILSSAITFYICYILFIFYPVTAHHEYCRFWGTLRGRHAVVSLCRCLYCRLEDRQRYQAIDRSRRINLAFALYQHRIRAISLFD